MTAAAPVLAIEDLHLALHFTRQDRPILRGIDLAIPSGSVHGLVGESGGGKTMVGKSVLGILPQGARITRGTIAFQGADLLALAERRRRALLGRAIAMIPQHPMTALNPVIRIEHQITDVLRLRLSLAAAEARRRAAEMLAEVHIRDPERVLRLYPHEISGGMCQRVVIAVAFACEPALVIADEPTTALDVTVQFQILRLIRDLQRRSRTAMLFISHDLGVVAKLCDTVSVIFAGRILETAPVRDIFERPRHDYTRALLAATPRYDRPDSVLHGVPPALTERLWQEAAAYDRAHGAA